MTSVRAHVWILLGAAIGFLGSGGCSAHTPQKNGSSMSRVIFYDAGKSVMITDQDPRYEKIMSELDSILLQAAEPLFLAIEEKQIDETKQTQAIEIDFPEKTRIVIGGNSESEVSRLFIPLGEKSKIFHSGEGTLVILGKPEWSAGPYLSTRPREKLLALLALKEGKRK